MGYDEDARADEVAEMEWADAHYDVLRAGLPADDVDLAVGEWSTVHRLAPRDGDAHRQAAFPAGGQVAMTLGYPGAGDADPRLDALAFDLTSTLDQLLQGDQPCRLTLVSTLINDRRTVEIVQGLAVDIDWTQEHGCDLVRFHDGDYVYLDDVISMRVEV